MPKTQNNQTRTRTGNQKSGDDDSDSVERWAGLAAVAIGCGAVAVIAIFAFFLNVRGDPTLPTLATAAFGVIGSIVGAYLGVKAGADTTRKAIQGQRDVALGPTLPRAGGDGNPPETVAAPRNPGPSGGAQ